MKSIFKALIFNLLLIPSLVFAQNQETVVKNILDETYNNSQLEQLAFELMDEIGPRLVGSPQMQQAWWLASGYMSVPEITAYSYGGSQDRLFPSGWTVPHPVRVPHAYGGSWGWSYGR